MSKKTLFILFAFFLLYGVYTFLNSPEGAIRIYDVNVRPTVIDTDITHQQKSFQLSGKTSSHTQTITINDTTLEQYIPGSENWEIVLSDANQNLQKGLNEYTIQAFDKDNTPSEPQVIMVNNDGIVSKQLEEGGAEVLGTISNVPNQ